MRSRPNKVQGPRKQEVQGNSIRDGKLRLGQPATPQCWVELWNSCVRVPANCVVCGCCFRQPTGFQANMHSAQISMSCSFIVVTSSCSWCSANFVGPFFCYHRRICRNSVVDVLAILLVHLLLSSQKLLQQFWCDPSIVMFIACATMCEICMFGDKFANNAAVMHLSRAHAIQMIRAQHFEI